MHGRQARKHMPLAAYCWMAAVAKKTDFFLLIECLDHCICCATSPVWDRRVQRGQ